MSMITKLFHCIWCLGTALLACLSISSCSEEYVPTVEEPLPVYSYFRGYLNDEYVCIEQNVAHDKRIDWSSTVTQGGKLLTYRWHVFFIDDYHKSFKGAPILSIQLDSLVSGRRYYIEGAHFDDIESAISFTMDEKFYTPKLDRPFKVSLGKLITTPPYGGAPLIAGAMEGILYNRDNPTDSLIIRDATFCLVTSGWE